MTIGARKGSRRGILHYEFWHEGARYRGSTHTADSNKAGRVVTMIRAAVYDGTFERKYGITTHRRRMTVRDF